MEEIMLIDKKVYHLFMIIWFIVTFLILVASWNDKIMFGLGLADIAIIGIIGLALVLVGYFYIVDYRSIDASKYITTQNIILMASCLIFLIFIILKMTIWRGPALPWNGQIFFNK